jgi:hypothetical protein
MDKAPLFLFSSSSFSIQHLLKRNVGCRPGLRLHNADGIELVAEWAREGQQVDLVIIDAFDGQDNVPPALTAEGIAFISHSLPHVSVRGCFKNPSQNVLRYLRCGMTCFTRTR